MTRPADFSEAVKRAVYRDSCGRCCAVDCGQTKAWRQFVEDMATVGLRVTLPRERTTLGWWMRMQVRFQEAARRYPRAAKDLARYRLGEATLDGVFQIDHRHEVADGGAGVRANAQVPCIVCHLDKTATRGRVRRKGPNVTKKYEQRRAG